MMDKDQQLEFIRAVQRMRYHQKAYFSTQRSNTVLKKSHLVESKKFESKVDAMLQQAMGETLF